MLPVGISLPKRVRFKINVSEAVLEAQASFVTSEARGQEASSERESLDDNDDDVERNADLYIVHFLIIKSLSVNFQ